MKALKRIVRLITVSILLLPGCKEITKSINETLNPGKASMEHHGKKTATNITTTVSSTTHKTHVKDQQVIVNGDTLNTTDMQEKAEAFFKDLEQLEKNKTPGNSEEIQKRVEKFLKGINLKQKTGTHVPAVVETRKTKQVFLNTAQLEKAEMKLRDLPQYAGKDIMVYQSVHFDEDGRIRLTLQHPQNPKYLDEYVYANGKWSAPKPVQAVARNIERRLMALDKISFPCAVNVLNEYNEKVVEVEGAKPTTYVYLSIWDNRMRWLPGTIDGTRERYSIDFNTNGTIKTFQQD
jgi:hypothetical protein